VKVFLEAEWRKLIMVNYAIDPKVLENYLPANTELDIWKGKCYVSLIGFMFLNTRVKGIKFPFHVNFEEVNLRFYVKRNIEGEMSRRGVVFIREIVPKPILSFIANKLYKEHYVSMPMQHEWKQVEDAWKIAYKWKKEKWYSCEVQVSNELQPILEGSEEEFITEHYWGYSKLSENKTLEYRVNHPRWEIYPVNSYSIEVDFKALYGQDFELLNHQLPDSVFLAEGSEIQVFNYRNIF
jgi:uncharacterized protein YqjF (DUF2071 family)